MPVGIIVKVRVRVTPLPSVARQTLCPLFELSTGEADAVRTVMEAHVAKRPNLRRVGRGRQRPADGDDQGTATICEDAGDVGTVPGGIAAFEGRAALAWQPGHKLLKPQGIGTPVGRELVEARPEPLAKSLGRIDEALQGLVDVAQLLEVRDVPAGLDGEEEAGVRCRLRGPGAELIAGGQTVEAAVDLDGREVLRVEREVIARGQLGRVEAPDPVRVDPAGGADPDRDDSPLRFQGVPLCVMMMRYRPDSTVSRSGTDRAPVREWFSVLPPCYARAAPYR